MSEIGSDNLHHFTHSFETLQSILLNGFFPYVSGKNAQVMNYYRKLNVVGEGTK